MKISLASRSLHRRFRAQDHPLSLLDFPRVARNEFGLHAVELNSQFFVSRDRRYLTELDNVAVGEAVDLLHISVDGVGDLCDPDRSQQKKVVEANAAWLPVAAHLGCKAIRVAAGGVGRENEQDAMLWCIDGYMDLAERGAKEGVIVMIENQPGIASDPSRIVQIIETVNNPWIGTLVDLAEFPPELDRYEAIEQLLPFAESVHVRMREFNEQGLELTLDVARCCYLAQRAKYEGHLGILFDNEGDSHEGVLKGKQLIEKCLSGEIKYDAPAKPVAAMKTMGKKSAATGKKISEGLKKIGFRFEI